MEWVRDVTYGGGGRRWCGGGRYRDNMGIYDWVGEERGGAGTLPYKQDSCMMYTGVLADMAEVWSFLTSD